MFAKDACYFFIVAIRKLNMCRKTDVYVIVVCSSSSICVLMRDLGVCARTLDLTIGVPRQIAVQEGPKTMRSTGV